jgi:hypothetical protein
MDVLALRSHVLDSVGSISSAVLDVTGEVTHATWVSEQKREMKPVMTS